jgi:cobalt/nickel transport system permease protein
VLAGGTLIAMALAVLSPLASKHPDGLNWVAAKAGFLQNARGPSYRIIPGYLFPGISNATLATIAAALLGVIIVLGVALLVAYSRRKRDRSGASEISGD